MVAKKSKGGPLGKALIRQRFGTAQRGADGSLRHTTILNDGTEYGRMASITQESDLEAFLNTAQLAGTEFTAEKLNVSVVDTRSPSTKNPFLLSELEEETTLKKQQQNSARLTIPRRPNWDETTTPEELDELERGSFLDWRRSLAQLEEDEQLLLTPYERNLEVWRQLWRVIERSDVVAQIVDARNPLLFRNADIVTYVEELARKTGYPKHSLLIVNKADLLTDEQKKLWTAYFEAQAIDYVFFSAAEAKENQKLGLQSNFVTEMLLLLEKTVPAKAASIVAGKKPVIGLLGYPNVGKSSTINALVDKHVVSVSSTPGKTKHFQTIELEKIVLCDCPGLVFPSFSTTKAEQVVNGILPIDQLREWTGPMQLLSNRIPKSIFYKVYGISINTPDEEGALVDRTPTASEVASAYAVARGFRKNTQGQPDEARAARYLLKDHVNGKTLYCTPPPGADASVFCQYTVDKQLQEPTKRSAAARDSSAETAEPRTVDSAFFAQALNLERPVGAHVKGKLFRPDNGYSSSAFTPADAPRASAKAKHHNKRNKHQKQRTKWVDE